MPSSNDADLRHMNRALALAAKGRGKVEPNPMVGAVVVKNGRIVGEGFHERFGSNHAEVNALLAAGRYARGATLYVTLEPCCHWGKTPPCTEAILHTGIRRVVAAMIDPFAQVHGQGLQCLREKGLQVGAGLLEEQARELNSPYITRLTCRRPYIIAKWAQSLDGRVALKPATTRMSAAAKPAWISSEASRAWVHKLRGRMDAILIGIRTALADNPLLTARPASRSLPPRTATRIVLDSQCRLPPGSRLVRTVSDAPLLIVHTKFLSPAAQRRRSRLAAKGAMTLGLPADPHGRPRLLPLLHHLADLEYTNLLLEGGPNLLASFLHQHLVDEAHIFLAPLLIGGPVAPHALAGPTLQKLPAAPPFRLLSSRPSGPDLHLTLRAIAS